MEFKVIDDAGTVLDATVEIAPGMLILQSRGGAKGSPSARNRQYADGLRLILQRLFSSSRQIEGIWVDSSRVQHIALPDRQVLAPQDLPLSATEAFSLVSQRMEAVGQAPGADPGKGNRNKRLRFELSGGSVGEIATLIGSKAGRDVPRHAMRLPAEELRRVGPDHIWFAVEALRAGASAERFRAATGLEVVIDDALRLPPKAVFGIAATAALGFQIEPSHFSSGKDQLALQLIAEAGFPVVRKGTAAVSEELPAAVEDQTWVEGAPKLAAHLRRERKRGLSKAKKAAFIREHGVLRCERCQMDPVAIFGDTAGEACIEVHHHATHVVDMEDGHVTKLEDVQCLCANCHRYVHMLLKLAQAKA